MRDWYWWLRYWLAYAWAKLRDKPVDYPLDDQASICPGCGSVTNYLQDEGVCPYCFWHWPELSAPEQKPGA